jgi:radical SAM protein with 4Fe4S-binding SPASM domain
MTKRKLGKIIKRIQHLPRSYNLILYSINKVKTAFYKLTKSNNVAYPATLMVELTNQCNLKCIICPREYDYGKQMDKGYMDFEKFQKVVDESYPYIDSIGLTGLGETFLYKKLEDAVRYIRNKSKGIIISASINATLPNTPEIVKKIVNVIDTIQISIDGLDATYNKIRVNGNYEIFRNNVREIVKICAGSETDVMLNMVVFKENYLEMNDVLKFAHQEGIKFVNYTPINLVSVTELDGSYYEFFTTGEFNSELINTIEESKKYPEIEFTYPNFETINKFQMCPYLWNYFYISWDGYIPPCCAKPFPKELNFGNVFSDGLINSLNSSSFIEFRNIWLNNKKPEFCSKCF